MGTKPIQIMHALYQLIQAIGMTLAIYYDQLALRWLFKLINPIAISPLSSFRCPKQ